MGSAVEFSSGGGDYRVITSGPSRPPIPATACTVVTSREREFRVVGGKDVNAGDRLGVSRVLGFEAPAGRTNVTCEDRQSTMSTKGRFQVVSADGPVSIAVVTAYGVGTLLIVLGIALFLVGHRRARQSDAASGGPTTSIPT